MSGISLPRRKNEESQSAVIRSGPPSYPGGAEMLGSGRPDRWGDLMIASQDGDEAAYDLLLREVSIWLMRYFRRRLPIQLAEESCQETLLAVHLRKETWVRGPFRPWVAAIARFKWMDQLRRQYRTPNFLDAEDIAVEDHGHRTLSTLLVKRMLEDLTPGQATAIRMVKLAGRSVEEAAEATGQSKSLIKVNVHRGLKRMLERLDSVNAMTIESGAK